MSNRDIVLRVEFRFRQHEEEIAQRLAESARAAGRCPSDHARELVKDALTHNELLHARIYALEQEVAQLHRQLRELPVIAEALRALQQNLFVLRDDLATYATKLLTDAGRVEPTAARKWVEKMLRTD